MRFTMSCWSVGFLMALLSADPVPAQVRESALIETSITVLQEVMMIPETTIPPSLVSEAQAVAIVPNVLKAGFIIGGRYGRGILVVRDKAGAWSNPIFVTLGGGSIGFQAGAQATDLILVFRNRRSVDGFLLGRGKFTLGADAAVSAGPVGRNLGAGTDVALESEILTYSRSRGLFAGLSLEGAVLSLDWQANVSFYGRVISPSEVLVNTALLAPSSAARLRGYLDQFAVTPSNVTIPGQTTDSPNTASQVSLSAEPPALAGAGSERSDWRKPNELPSPVLQSTATGKPDGTKE